MNSNKIYGDFELKKIYIDHIKELSKVTSYNELKIYTYFTLFYIPEAIFVIERKSRTYTHASGYIFKDINTGKILKHKNNKQCIFSLWTDGIFELFKEHMQIKNRYILG